MFERFTDKARHAVVLAQDEAREFGQPHIGTEHVLLGLVHEGEGVAAVALRGLGIDLEVCRADVAAIVGRGSGAPSGHIPFTPAAKKVLERSLREALGLGHNYIGTEHMILGLISDEDGVTVQVLARHDITADTVRAAVHAALRTVLDDRSRATPSPRRTAGADAILAAAQELAGTSPMGSQHLLVAMSLLDDSLAAGALAALGIERDALADAIANLDVDGTTDVTPEDAAARQMEIRLADDEVHIVLRDPAALAQVRDLTGKMGNPITGTDPIGSPLVELWQATMRSLTNLSARILPDDEVADKTDIPAIVRGAIRDRLRRRR
jgi:ATP-dependent Clp protease ATP-binding subunit ClpA